MANEIKQNNQFDVTQLRFHLKIAKMRIRSKNLFEIVTNITELANELSACYNDFSELDHNLAISSKHAVMQDIKKICEKFKMLSPGQKFKSAEELWEVLAS